MRALPFILGGFFGGQLSLQLLFILAGLPAWAPAWLAALGPLIVGATFGYIAGSYRGGMEMLDKMGRELDRWLSQHTGDRDG